MDLDEFRKLAGRDLDDYDGGRSPLALTKLAWRWGGVAWTFRRCHERQ